jgi:hypothetical protein
MKPKNTRTSEQQNIRTAESSKIPLIFARTSEDPKFRRSESKESGEKKAGKPR